MTTTPPNNPQTDSTPSQPGRALLVARLLIAASLLVGVGVFGVYAINELSNTTIQPATSNSFGAADELPAQRPGAKPSQTGSAQAIDPLTGMVKRNPNQYIEINRDNPHPGELTPFVSADSVKSPPYRQPPINGVIWEFADYQADNVTPQAAYEHYNQQALQSGLRPTLKVPTSQKLPGGLRSVWSDGTRELRLTAWPLTTAAPVPLKPEVTLKWVVNYSYPATTRKD